MKLWKGRPISTDVKRQHRYKTLQCNLCKCAAESKKFTVLLSNTHPSSDGQGFRKPRGYTGKGQGTDLKTLEKPLPLSRVRGYP